MADREELKSMVDQLPDASLEMVRALMEHHIHPPPPPPPEFDALQRRGQEYRKRVEQQFKQTRKPGTISGFSNVGSSGMHEGTPFGRNSFHYWDGDALVQQTLQSFDMQDIEIMQRFSATADGTDIQCVVELSSGGRTVRHEERFPRVKRS